MNITILMGEPVCRHRAQVYDKAHWKREPGVTTYLSTLKRLAVGP